MTAKRRETIMTLTYTCDYRPADSEQLVSMDCGEDKSAALDAAEKASAENRDRWVEVWRFRDGKRTRLIAQFKNGDMYL